jgi:hypothetical protein
MRRENKKDFGLNDSKHSPKLPSALITPQLKVEKQTKNRQTLF